jgi:hypothetical protein
MKWFGNSWGAPICESPHVETPVGVPCVYCEEPIQLGDRGVIIPHVGQKGCDASHPWHMDCFLRTVVGSVGHQKQKCSCFGGNEDDPPGMTKREAATAAARLFKEEQ